MKRFPGISLIALLLLVFNAAGATADGIIVSNAWMPVAPPNAKVIAGYLSIENKTSHKMTLTGISSKHFERVEIHRTEMHGDLMRMVQQDSLAIPSGDVIHLQPGGYHLMCIRPSSVPKEGESVRLSLQFDRGDPALIDFVVRHPDSGRMKHSRH